MDSQYSRNGPGTPTEPLTANFDRFLQLSSSSPTPRLQTAASHAAHSAQSTHAACASRLVAHTCEGSSERRDDVACTPCPGSAEDLMESEDFGPYAFDMPTAQAPNEDSELSMLLKGLSVGSAVVRTAPGYSAPSNSHHVSAQSAQQTVGGMPNPTAATTSSNPPGGRTLSCREQEMAMEEEVSVMYSYLR